MPKYNIGVTKDLNIRLVYEYANDEYSGPQNTPFEWDDSETASNGHDTSATTITPAQFAKYVGIDSVWENLPQGNAIREKIREVFQQKANPKKVEFPPEGSKEQIYKLQHEVTQLRTQVKQMQQQMAFLINQVSSLQQHSKAIESGAADTPKNTTSLFGR